MTIEYAVSRETTSLVKPSKPTLYPQAKIDFQHHQLKHRMSIGESDTIYYCSGHEIYALHTKPQKRVLVKSLPWEPQCLDAAYGWICAGGGQGQCALIRIANDQDGQSRSGPRQRRAEVDEVLPLDLDPMSRSLITQELQHPVSSSLVAAKYDFYSHTLGKEIVNSVTIHKMQNQKRGLEEEVIVIATNNDKTVRIYSLSQFKSLMVLTYPVSMNHATMAPDSDLLLAVGDKGQAFFHRRVQFERPTVVCDHVYPTYGWLAVAEPLLPRTSASDGCFSTRFSPSGHWCAVASEGGIVTIYDASLITDDMERDDAVVCVMKTSRPSIRPDFIGAARSMSFSPSPWDLLAIAEDQGRVTVLDLRSPEFVSRQTLELSTASSDVLLGTFSEAQTSLEQRQLELERRFLASHREAIETQNYLAAVTNSADHLEYAVQEFELNSEVHVDNVNRLTESERRIVDSIGLRRTPGNDDNASSATTAPVTVNYTPSSSNTHNASSLYSANVPSSNPLASDSTLRDHPIRFIPDAEDMSSSTLLSNTALTSRDHQSRSTSSIAEYVHQRNIERERQRISDRQPRRRSSVVISNSSTRNTNNNASTLAPIGGITTTLSTSPSRIHSSSSNTSPVRPTSINEAATRSRDHSFTLPSLLHNLTDATISNVGSDRLGEALYEASSSAARGSRDPGLSTRRPASEIRPLTNSNAATDHRIYQSTMDLLVARNTRERVTSRLRELGHPAASDSTRNAYSASQRYVGGPVVQGVAWSQDGRLLFVATERGLLEFKINIRERMQWPGVAFL